MSAKGQKQTFCDATAMSALPQKADMRDARTNVGFGSEADIRRYRLIYERRVSTAFLKSCG
jgi:hypothetical protein